MVKPNHSPIIRLGMAFGALICLISAPVSGFFLTRIFLEAKASAQWPSVVGTINKAEVQETAVGHFSADVSYTYRVAGQEFTGTRIRTSDGEYNIRDGAVQAIDGLQVGQSIPVFYNPAQPEQAVLRNGAGVQEYVLLLVPLGFLGFAVCCFRALWQTRQGT